MNLNQITYRLEYLCILSVYISSLFCLCFFFSSFFTSPINIHTILTFVAQILKLGAVIILIQYLDSELTDADERLLGPISGRYCNWILSLPLPVEAPGCHNHSCKKSEASSGPFINPPALRPTDTRGRSWIHSFIQQFFFSPTSPN